MASPYNFRSSTAVNTSQQPFPNPIEKRPKITLPDRSIFVKVN